MTEDVNGINWIKIGDTKKDGKYINSCAEKIIPEGMSKSRFVKKGDFLLTNSMSFGRPYILNIDGCIHDGWLVFSSWQSIFEQEYLYYMLSSKFAYNQFCSKVSGAVVKNLNIDKVVSSIFPIPPLPEQKRIVKRIKEIEPCIEKYTIYKQRDSMLEDTLLPNLKKSLLQYAIQGKLVKQNPDDEPASVLLDRIRAEKELLIKDGKIKSSKNESYIYRASDNSYYEKFADGKTVCIDENIPFEIPENWCWCRLGSISTYGDTKQKVSSLYVESSMWQLDLEDIEKGGNILRYRTVAELNSKGDKTRFRKGDILYSKLRPYLLKILIATNDGICTPEIVPFKMYGEINSLYVVNYLKSPYVDNYINSITYGVKMPRVSTETMIRLLVPLPPLDEQKLIVKKYEEIANNL